MKTADKMSLAIIFIGAVYFLTRFAVGVLFNI
jgi:hypothetical protein